jgi:hypothetical protein
LSAVTGWDARDPTGRAGLQELQGRAEQVYGVTRAEQRYRQGMTQGRDELGDYRGRGSKPGMAHNRAEQDRTGQGRGGY